MTIVSKIALYINQYLKPISKDSKLIKYINGKNNAYNHQNSKIIIKILSFQLLQAQVNH